MYEFHNEMVYIILLVTDVHSQVNRLALHNDDYSSTANRHRKHVCTNMIHSSIISSDAAEPTQCRRSMYSVCVCTHVTLAMHDRYMCECRGTLAKCVYACTYLWEKNTCLSRKWCGFWPVTLSILSSSSSEILWLPNFSASTYRVKRGKTECGVKWNVG